MPPLKERVPTIQSLYFFIRNPIFYNIFCSDCSSLGRTRLQTASWLLSNSSRNLQLLKVSGSDEETLFTSWDSFVLMVFSLCRT